MESLEQKSVPNEQEKQDEACCVTAPASSDHVSNVAPSESDSALSSCVNGDICSGVTDDSLPVDTVQSEVCSAMNNIKASGNASNMGVGSSSVSQCENLGALGGLNVYDSDSDDVPEVVPHVQNSTPISNVVPNKYRDVELEDTDSDSSISDSEESSSSSSESSSDEISPLSDSESICEAQSKSTNQQRKPPRTDGELLLEDLPPIEDLHITVQEQECMEVGKVSAIVDKMVVVQALKNTPALDIDSILFLDKGQSTLGRIFDVIGPVCEPAYCVRFNSMQHIREKGIEKGLPVYCAPKTDHTSYVFLGELLKMKGSDASWKANNEPPQEYLDFSDDEEERRARRRKRQAPSDVGTSSTPEIVEPSSYERRMNAKNAARSRIPQPEQTPPHFSRGRGWIRPVNVIQNVHSVPPGGPQYGGTPHRPGYAMPLRPPAWPTQGAMPMFPNAVPPIPPPYQFGLGTGPFFPVPPPAMGHHPLAPHLFSSPPPSRPPHPHYPYHQHQPPY